MPNPPRPQYPEAGPPPARPAPPPSPEPPSPEQDAEPPRPQQPPEYPAPTYPTEAPSYPPEDRGHPTAPPAEDPAAPPKGAYGPPSDAPPGARSHPHEMAFSRRRIHLKEQQRGADATTVGTLLLHVPGFLCSLALVTGVSYLLLPALGWLPPCCGSRPARWPSTVRRRASSPATSWASATPPAKNVTGWPPHGRR